VGLKRKRERTQGFVGSRSDAKKVQKKRRRKFWRGGGRRKGEERGTLGGEWMPEEKEKKNAEHPKPVRTRVIIKRGEGKWGAGGSKKVKWG